ncbi:MAG TPA: DUF1080 domain-containing protein [Fibrobacteria bacterium]|nr:DUF1080 domain-containing protein [Fibrobacteria bacterium]
MTRHTSAHFLIALAALAAMPAAAQAPNALTLEEKASGWKLLFDGTSNAGWVKPSGAPGAFVVEDGSLRNAGGDICTEAEYQDFEFSADYKYAAGGNSGIFLRTRRGVDPPYRSGLEIAVQDNGKAGNLCETCDAAVYDIKAASVDKWTGPDKWNTQRIRVEGNKLDVWHNGTHVIDLDMGTEEWAALVKDSKFGRDPSDPTWKEWHKETQGQICLQDHGSTYKVWFRALKVLSLSAASLPRKAPRTGLRWEVRGTGPGRLLAVDAPGTRELELKVLALSGREEVFSRSRGPRAVLSLGGLQPGMYWLQFAADGRRSDQRVVLF